jgi:hypothetical protein
VADETRALADVYWDVMMDEPTDLEPFVRRAAAGEWGDYAAADVRDFLRQIEQDILGSITTKAGAMALSHEAVEERAEETRQMIEGLIRKYAAGA